MSLLGAVADDQTGLEQHEFWPIIALRYQGADFAGQALLPSKELRTGRVQSIDEPALSRVFWGYPQREVKVTKHGKHTRGGNP